MTMMDFLGFNPEAVEKYSVLCETALEQAGFTAEEIDNELNVPAQERMREIISYGIGIDLPKEMLPVDVILNTIGENTTAALSERYPEEEFSYLIDTWTGSKLVVNGVEYDPSKAEIDKMFKEFYADEPLVFTDERDFELVERFVEDGKVSFGCSMSFDNLCEALTRSEKRGEIGTQEVDEILEDNYTVEDSYTVDVYVYRTDNEVTLCVETSDTKHSWNVPLTRGERERLMELTQGLYEEKVKETSKKVPPSVDLGG